MDSNEMKARACEFLQALAVHDAERSDSLKGEGILDIINFGEALHRAQAQLICQGTYLPHFQPDKDTNRVYERRQGPQQGRCPGRVNETR